MLFGFVEENDEIDRLEEHQCMCEQEEEQEQSLFIVLKPLSVMIWQN